MNSKRILALLICIMLMINLTVIGSDEVKSTELKFSAYINGFEDGTFRAENYLTRAEAATIIAKLMITETDSQAVCNFDDVNNSQWYYKSIAQLQQIGYFKDEGSSFRPKDNITRAELIGFIYQTGLVKSNSIKNFTDVNYTNKFFEFIGKAGVSGIINGYEDGTFKPENPITRAEAVTVVNKTFQQKADISTTVDINKYMFSDINSTYWAFYDIVLAAGKDKNQSYPFQISSDYNTKQFDAYNKAGNEWKNVMMVSQAQLDAGITGGEGGQWPQSLAVDSVEGSFLLVGTDVGGILRSIDGGATWEHANKGYHPIGGFGFAIDPNNISRALSVGSAYMAPNKAYGIYLTTDKAYTWKQTLCQPGANLGRDFREQVSFDPTTNDEKIGGSAVAYWSRPWRLQGSPDMARVLDPSKIKVYDGDKPGLWKSIDGGETWNVVNSEMSDGIVKVNPKDGTVYVANLDGFHRSTDGGVTFETILSGNIICGLDVIPTRPDYVYLNDYIGVMISTDSGKTFKRVESKSFPESVNKNDIDAMVRSLKVSPVDPNNMLVSFMNGNQFRNKKYYSNDGGITWNQSFYDESKDWMKVNEREPIYVWHPTDANKAWSFGGDWVSSSNDKGKTFIWDYSGGNAIFVDQRTIFNIYNPDIFYYGSQDFHGGLTIDGGKTWKHVWKFAGVYGGFVYGSYAADANTLIAIVADHQGSSNREIYVSRDAGETWMQTGVKMTDNVGKKWAEICYQSPRDPNVLFAANYRSADYGYSWDKMTNVDAVYCHNPYDDKELYGSYKNKIMVSNDDGASWQEYDTVRSPSFYADKPEETEIWDMSYDGINKIMYYISGHAVATGLLFCKIQNGVTTDMTDRLEKCEWGGTLQLCAIDPRYPDIIYVGGFSWAYGNTHGVQRSVDGGKTFQTLTPNTEGNSVVNSGPYGGHEPYDMIVNPATGELWIPQNCAGWVKFAPPYEN